MHHELFEEMQVLIARDDLSDADESRLAELLDLHDSGQAYFASTRRDGPVLREGVSNV